MNDLFSIPATHNQPEYTVSEISQALKRSVESNFNHVRVRGEISGFKRAASGHLYFNLKDENAVLNAICWKGTALKFQPQDGLEVRAIGRLTTFAGRSNYQIVVESMEPAGIGALLALFEERKKKYEKEGLFDAKHKKPLPYLPLVIGVVTSPDGAVFRDILHRLEERCGVRVILFPTPVQGEGAAKKIADMITLANKLPEVALGTGHWALEEKNANAQSLMPNAIPRPDLLIVGRGGGSFEDLWAYNEDEVVRAVFASQIPVISAVGHEPDFTLMDFVADRRAPTPTGAAEMAVPVKADLLEYLLQVQRRVYVGITRNHQERGQYLAALARGLMHPSRMLEQLTQKLDQWSERSATAMQQYLMRKNTQLQGLAGRVTHPRQMLLMMAEKLQDRALRLKNIAPLLWQVRTEKLAQLARLLENVNYRAVLKRGFALVRDDKGQLVHSKTELISGKNIHIEMTDGVTEAVVQ